MAVEVRARLIAILILLLAIEANAQSLKTVLSSVRPSIGTVWAEGKGQGTGFVVREDGLFVTAEHVIQGAVGMSVTFPDGHQVDVEEIVLEDVGQDFAILKLAGNKFTPLVVVG